MQEEIIIDGVDVAGCKYYHYKGCTANNLCKCGNSINCYYKQLKRLEQECEVLKDNNNHLRVIIDDGRAENKRFKEENKELKKKLELDEVQLESYFIGEEKICKENEKYRSALEEIRTYLNTLSSIDNDFPNTETYLRIQDKINEVLND